jgi:hypothetical protein
MKKLNKKFIVITVIIAITLGIFLPFLVNPLRRTNNQVRNYILRITPLGTNVEDVIKIIEDKKRWKIQRVAYFGDSHWKLDYTETVGIQKKYVHLGYYWIVFKTNVSATWIFDEDGKLVDVEIRRDTDGL